MNRTLTLSDHDSGLCVAVGFDRWDDERAQFWYQVRAGSESLCEGSDLRLGARQQPCEAKALATLLSFLGAYAEAVSYDYQGAGESDNLGLFPDSMRDAAFAVGADGFWEMSQSLSEDEPN